MPAGTTPPGGYKVIAYNMHEVIMCRTFFQKILTRHPLSIYLNIDLTSCGPLGDNVLMDSYEYRHLTARILPRKDIYLNASHSIQDSFTGLVGMIGLHRLFTESALEIRNAIYQYENGFTGSAFYCVRTAVELARVVAYFATIKNPSESDVYAKWAKGDKFPFDSHIKKDIETTGEIYSQVKSATGAFFDDQSNDLKKYQKYIHKQGYIGFYDRGFSNAEKEAYRREKIEREFIAFITGSLKEIAMLRLCVDPFPVLLNDPGVRRKIHFESMTYPFCDDLIELIGDDLINAYKETEYYQGHVDYFSSNDDISDEALTLINDSYYCRKDWDAIEPFMKHFNVRDRTAVLIFNTSQKVAKIYALGGFEQWFSDIRSLRANQSWSSESLFTNDATNVPYDGALLSRFVISSEEYWIEHNDELTMQEIRAFGSIDPVIE